MDFFKKLGDTLSNTGKDIAKKTKDFSDTSKLKSEISKQQDLINKNYTEIGKYYFNNCSNLDYPNLKELCESIKKSNEQIAELQTQINQIKGITNCPNCNQEVSTSAAFCGNCGYKLKDEAVAEPVVTTDVTTEPTTEATTNTVDTIDNPTNNTNV